MQQRHKVRCQNTKLQGNWNFLGDVCEGGSGRLNGRNIWGWRAGRSQVDGKGQGEKLLREECEEWEVWLQEWTIRNGSRGGSKRKRRRM